MALFHKVEGAFAILLGRGVYTQAPLFELDGCLFAQRGSGFIGLYENATSRGTTIPVVNWLHLEGVDYETDRLGRLLVKKKRS